MIPKLKMGLMAVACAAAVAGFQPGTADADQVQPAASVKVAEQPNILLLFADDLGYADAGFQNQSQDVVTPNMDRLAANGAIMTTGYVTAGVCGPSRAGMMTGRYQQRFGYHDNVAPFVRDENVVQGLPTELKTMANYLKSAGYHTGLVGKWHDGDEEQFWPYNRGFDEFFGFNNGAANYFIGPKNMQEAKNRPWGAMYRNDQPVEDFDDYLTDRFGQEAVDYLERHKDEPFFLYVAFNAIHGPLQAKPEDLERFKHIEDENRRISVAMNYNMDQNIGMILDKLDDLGLRENTLIYFLSDNGGKPKGNASYNTPLRGVKGTYYEGGIRIPYTVSWQGKIPAGQTLTEPVSSLDILPTSLAAAGVIPKEEWQFEGVNLLPYLMGEEKEVEERFLYWDNHMRYAVRDGEWKLVLDNKNVKNAEPELFRIADDMSETKDLASEYPEQVARLKKAYDEWNADNDTPKWGWSKKLYPYSNGYRGRS